MSSGVTEIDQLALALMSARKSVGRTIAELDAARRDALSWWARLNLAVIAPYPVLMILVVVTGLVDSSLGQGLVLTDGAAVAAVAVLHLIGLRTEQSATHARLA